MAVQSATPFQVTWDMLPKEVRRTPPSFLTKLVCKIAVVAAIILSALLCKTLFAGVVTYFVIKFFATRAILPAAFLSESKIVEAEKVETACQDQLRETLDLRIRNRSPHFSNYNSLSNHLILTPDGAQLEITQFHYLQVNQNGVLTNSGPTMIYFGGNGELKQHWLLGPPFRPTSNCVFFNYRGCGRSTGTFLDSKDLVIDGLSVVEWLHREQQVPYSQIHFYGKSLGGAVALKTKAANEQLTGKLISDRSFSSIANVLSAIWSKMLCGWGRVFAPLAKLAVKVFELELDAAADLPKLQGPKLVISHKKDEAIPEEARLASHVAPSDRLEIQNDTPSPHNDELPDTAHMQIRQFLQ